MKLSKIIELLDIEHECMLRASHDDCNRDCSNCDIVQDDDELHEMYIDAIYILKQKWREAHELSEYFCIPCCLCNKYFNKDGSCPNEVESCSSEEHWELLLERIRENAKD